MFSDSDWVLKFFYAERVKSIFYIQLMIKIFEYLPTYCFSMAFGLIVTRASTRLDYNTLNWVSGKPFGNFEYYEEKYYEIKTTRDEIYAPSAA